MSCLLSKVWLLANFSVALLQWDSVHVSEIERPFEEEDASWNKIIMRNIFLCTSTSTKLIRAKKHHKCLICPWTWKNTSAAFCINKFWYAFFPEKIFLLSKITNKIFVIVFANLGAKNSNFFENNSKIWIFVLKIILTRFAQVLKNRQNERFFKIFIHCAFWFTNEKLVSRLYCEDRIKCHRIDRV